MGTRHLNNALALGNEVTTVDPLGGDFSSLEAALIGRYDAAVIASPSHLHAEHATQCLNAGIATLCEKPLASRHVDAVSLMGLAISRGVLAMVAQSYRYHRGINLLKERMSDAYIGKVGYIGTPLMVNYFSGQHLSQWYPDRDYKEMYVSRREQGGGIQLTSLTHQLDTIRYLFGEITTLNGKASNSRTLGIDVEDMAVMSGRTTTKTFFTASSDFLQRENTHRITVVGTHGEGTLDLAHGIMGCTWKWSNGDEMEMIHLGPCDDRYRLELEDFLAVVRGGKPNPIPLSEGCINMNLIEKYVILV